jgi:hypothetical protein
MKLYSQRQVIVAAFLGSPLAGGILMAHNSRASGQGKEGRMILGITTAVSIVILLTPIPHTKPIVDRFLIPSAEASVMGIWYQKAQGDFLDGGRFPNANRGSWRVAIGISLLVAIIQLILFFGFVTIFPGALGKEF